MLACHTLEFQWFADRSGPVWIPLGPDASPNYPGDLFVSSSPQHRPSSGFFSSIVSDSSPSHTPPLSNTSPSLAASASTGGESRYARRTSCGVTNI